MQSGIVRTTSDEGMRGTSSSQALPSQRSLQQENGRVGYVAAHVLAYLANVMFCCQAILSYLDIQVLEQDMVLEAAVHSDSESDA